ncbi:MAG: hypothetical protein RIT04_33 [Candidatus Parcubacteria bacterium]|jgi:DNA processing protein
MNNSQLTQSEFRCISGESIPYLLRQIPHPPKQLWVEGDLPTYMVGGKTHTITSEYDTRKYLCVIGSRKHSSYARHACEKLISGLAGYNICIVSGLALGIDSIAHEAALEAGLVTIAFPGSGLHRSVLYPPSKHTLARRIIEAGGALISEFDLTQHSQIWTFPQRNRLMAGMCHATLVIEATEDSGTLITAGLASDYNREVLALPGDIFTQGTYGPHKLLASGAHIARSSDDILRVLGIEPRVSSDSISTLSQLTNFTPFQQTILKTLSTESLTIDELYYEITKISPIEIQTLTIAITELQLQQAVLCKDGKVSICL